MAKIKTKYFSKILVGDSISLKQGDNWSEPYPIKHICRDMYFFGNGRSISLDTIKIRMNSNSLKVFKKGMEV